jgi:hypothetical protein
LLFVGLNFLTYCGFEDWDIGEVAKHENENHPRKKDSTKSLL